jgi:hypothetical protein
MCSSALLSLLHIRDQAEPSWREVFCDKSIHCPGWEREETDRKLQGAGKEDRSKNLPEHLSQ